MLSREATNTNFIVFRSTRSELEPKIYHEASTLTITPPMQFKGNMYFIKHPVIKSSASYWQLQMSGVLDTKPCVLIQRMICFYILVLMSLVYFNDQKTLKRYQSFVIIALKSNVQNILNNELVPVSLSSVVIIWSKYSCLFWFLANQLNNFVELFTVNFLLKSNYKIKYKLLLLNIMFHNFMVMIIW